MTEHNPLVTEKKEYRYAVCVSSHQGSVRTDNEDNFVVNNVIREQDHPEANLRGDDIPQPLVCAVFDGMGGEMNGGLASQICAEQSKAVYSALQGGTAELDDIVRSFVVNSNSAVVRMLENSLAKRGGSTFVMVVMAGGAVYPYSLGDSRLYHYDGAVLRQITNDHTLAMKKYYANIYTLEEARESSDSHKLTSFLGVDFDEEGLSPEAYRPFELLPGEKLLLCSDGLYDMCGDDEILALLSEPSPTVSLDLVDKAIENGGHDNVTCLVIERQS